MAEEILQNSTASGVSERRFYRNVNKFTKEWLERAYNMVMTAKTEEEKKRHADFTIQFLR